MEVTTHLRETLERLYRVFARYPVHESTNPCRCCHSPADEVPLHSKPLRQLSENDLAKYAFDALFVWGSEDDFKHFLPRMLELLVTAEVPTDFINPEVLIGKLAYASWGTWPDEERSAIQEFLYAMWHAALSTAPRDLLWPDITRWLTAIARVEDDLSRYLDDWLNEDSPHTHYNLALLILDLGLPYNAKVPVAYWEGRREQWGQLRQWSALPAVRRKLEAGIEAWPDSPYSDELLEAAAFLPS